MLFDYLQSLDIFSWEIITLLIFAGFLTGVVNTFAGSGTVISYSLFMFLGLPVSHANGTVRMGVILQTLAAAINFNRKKVLDVKKGLLLGIPITLGSILGAQIAVSIDKDIFEKIVAIVLILMLFFLFKNPDKWIKEKKEISSKNPTKWHYLIYFLIGIYGGFIHMGVGIFLLAALVLISGYDLVKANALKIFTVFLYSPFVLIVFMLNGHIDYAMGLFSSIGNLIGGIIASYFAIKQGANFVRGILIVVIILFSAQLLGLYELIF
jgi:uncharacterized membrane protein YfcA